MSGKSFFIDMTKCTACRGCQVACKQWHKLPATETKQTGTHQNPADLSAHTYKLVRFSETQQKNGDIRWLFFPEQCRHCTEPPCKAVADGMDDKAVVIDEATGAVLYTEATKAIDGVEAGELCPYNIPRRDEKTGQWFKCTMCIDRVQNGLKPACVQSCPTGAMSFGERDEMLKLAKDRLAQVKKTHPEASLVNPDTVRVIYLTAYKAKEYYQYLLAEAPDLGPLTRKQLLAKMARPFRVVG